MSSTFAPLKDLTFRCFQVLNYGVVNNKDILLVPFVLRSPLLFLCCLSLFCCLHFAGYRTASLTKSLDSSSLDRRAKRFCQAEGFLLADFVTYFDT